MQPSRFLIVDADAATAEKIARTFAGVGYRYDTVRTGAEALGCIAKSDYSTVLMAERLPDGDGLDCFLRLRRQARGLTGLLMVDSCDVTSVFAAVNYGIEHVIPKPINFSELLQVCSNLGPSRANQSASPV